MSTTARPDLAIRRMRRADVAAVARLERATFTMPWSEATFRGLLRRKDVAALVAFTDAGELAGYVVAWGVYDQGELANLCVLPERFGSGLADRLLSEVIERLTARDIRQLFLEVRASNVRAQRFYQRHGFREVGRRPRYYVEPDEDALVLYRALAPLDAGERPIVIPEDTFEDIEE